MNTSNKITKWLLGGGLNLLLMLSILGSSDDALAGTITVCTSGCDYTSIQDAVDAANPSGDVIQVSAGTYTENITIHNKDLTLLGAGAESTFVDGGGTGSVFFNGHYYYSPHNAVTISSMTIMNGNAASGSGGGILNYSVLTLENCVVKNNSTAWSGGGIHNVLFESSGILTLINSKIIDNNAESGGGGIFNFGTVNLINSTVSDNIAGSDGGGIVNQGTMMLVDSTVSHNNASTLYSKKPGGGIYNVSGAMLTLVNSTISGNESATGGGIANYGTLGVASSTVTDNKSTYTYASGGIQNWASGSASLKNTIVAGNTGDYGDLRGPPGSWSSGGYNLIGNNTSDYAASEGDQVGTSADPIDPLLGPLQDNGGTTETHALLEDSPAIDAGNPAGCTDVDDHPAFLTTDQRGAPRPVDGDGDGISRCDIGAFEIELAEIPVAVDIKPGSCSNPLNVKSKGKLPVAIMGTYEFDVDEIDLASLRLAGVAPTRSSMEDVGGPGDAEDCDYYGPDGWTDLTLKFNIQDIASAIGDVNDGDEVVLTLTGNLKEDFGGSAIHGDDVVFIIRKGKE